MYVSLRNRPSSAVADRGTRRRVANTVLALGAVSLVTDISTESVNAVLPNYLIYVIGLSPQAFGVVNGLYNGVSAFVRVLGGWAADRTDRPKWIAFTGYAVSTVGKIALLSAHSLGAFSAIATSDQLGKGLRTAPRDSMIVESSDPAALGRAFGVHRFMDTCGAFLGPLMAFWVLYLAADDYHSVFVVSGAFAIIGLAVLVLVVPDLRPGHRRRAAALAIDTAATPAAGAGSRPRVSLRLLLTPDMVRLTLATGLLGLVSIGETFVFLQLQSRNDLASTYYPLLIVGMNLAYLLLAVPLGRLADRIGRWRVFIAGYVALLVAYLGAGGPFDDATVTCACLVMLGAYYAATDGMLAAMAGQSTPAPVRGSAIASAQTVLAASAFCSSIGFTLLWSRFGRTDSLLIVAGALAVVLPVAAVLLRGAVAARRPTEPATQPRP